MITALPIQNAKLQAESRSATQTSVACLVTLLHQNPHDHSATRFFASKPVLYWTLKRLMDLEPQMSLWALACWEDQLSAVQAVVDELELDSKILLHNNGQRKSLAAMDAVTKARRWADGWRGGLLSSCWFDLGFDLTAALDISKALDVQGIISLPGESPFVQTELLSSLVGQFKTARQEGKDEQEVFFSSAAPGLCGVLVSTAYLQRQQKLNHSLLHPGTLLHYRPESPRPDPLSSPTCISAHPTLTRTTLQFNCDSVRQVRFLESLLKPLRCAPDQLSTVDLVSAVEMQRQNQAVNLSVPRDVYLEITTQRQSKPIFSAFASPWLAERVISRPCITKAQLQKLLTELSDQDDLRLTFGGCGDPLLHPDFPQFLTMACDAGIACCVETDLIDLSEDNLSALLKPGVDLILVHIPAASSDTYSRVMGTESGGLAKVLNNLKRLAEAKEELMKAGMFDLPLLVPCFTKCSANLAEMEPWYDHFLKALGSAVIQGASTLAGQITSQSPANLSPPLRKSCRRIERSVSILSDGSVVPCDQDPSGNLSMGNVFVSSGNQQDLMGIWTTGATSLLNCHKQWAEKSPTSLPQLCSNCTEWHRP